MFGATDWVLKRLAKFLLKRTLGRLLHPDVDMDLLEVALGSGSMAMHRVLLDCDHINELLVRQPYNPAPLLPLRQAFHTQTVCEPACHYTVARRRTRLQDSAG